MARVPNLVATKTMTGDLGVIAGVVREAPELMHFLTEQSVAYGSLFGEVGLLGTYGALAPKHAWALLEAAQRGDARGAAEIGVWFGRLNDAVFDPLMADRRVDGAYDKTIEQAERRPRGLPAADALAVPLHHRRRVPGRATHAPRAFPRLRLDSSSTSSVSSRAAADAATGSRGTSQVRAVVH